MARREWQVTSGDDAQVTAPIDTWPSLVRFSAQEEINWFTVQAR